MCGDRGCGFKARSPCDDGLFDQSSFARHGHPRREAGPQSHGTPPECAGLPEGMTPVAAHHRAAYGPEDVTATARQEEVTSCPRLSVSRTLVVWGSCSPPVSPVRLSRPWRARRLSTSGPRARLWSSAAPLSPIPDLRCSTVISVSRREPRSTGFGLPAVVNGATHDDDAVAAQAQSDVTTAYNVAAGQPVPAGNDLTGQDLGGLTLTAGAYGFSSSAQLTGQLTLDAAGDPNAQFVFEIGSTLTTASASSIRLINGASPCNVYWQIGSSATLGSTTAFEGNLMAHTSITVNNGSTVQGRVLASTGAVTLDNNVIDGSMCGTSTTTPPGSTPPTTTTPAPPVPTSTLPVSTPTTLPVRHPTPPRRHPTPPRRHPTPPPASHSTVPTRKGHATLTRPKPRPPASCNAGFTATVRGR